VAETYYIGAYWGPRRESAEDCARRAEALFQSLESVDPLFTHWFKHARTRKEALKRPLEREPIRLRAYIQRSIVRDDVRAPMEELGFSAWLWNGGGEDTDVGLNFACGGCSKWVPNSCLVNPPNRGPHAERVLTVPVLTAILRCLVFAWDPDWGVVTSPDHRDVISTKGKPGTFVGWITYHARRRGTVPPLPVPAQIEPVEDQGSFIILTPERLTASNPEHVEQAARIMELLGRAKLLEPVVPLPSYVSP
jgi:hypothetical protein